MDSKKYFEKVLIRSLRWKWYILIFNGWADLSRKENIQVDASLGGPRLPQDNYSLSHLQRHLQGSELKLEFKARRFLFT